MKVWKGIAGLALAGVLAAAGAIAQTKSTAQAPAKKAAAPAYNRALLEPARLTAKAPEEYEAKFTTTKGDFVVKVTRAWSPLGADRFYNLVKNGFYDNVTIFRVVPGFVVQFGISGHPRVAAVWQKANIQDDPVRASNTRGMITFATAGANSRTTQVFINYANNGRLDSMGFSPFGQVSEGMEVVDQLYSGYGGEPSDHQDKITAQGNAFLQREYPKLDRIVKAVIVSPAPAPAKAPTKTPVKKSP